MHGRATAALSQWDVEPPPSTQPVPLSHSHFAGYKSLPDVEPAALQKQADHCNDRRMASKRVQELSTNLFFAILVKVRSQPDALCPAPLPCPSQHLLGGARCVSPATAVSPQECGPLESEAMVMGVLNQAFDVLVLRFGVQKRIYCNVSSTQAACVPNFCPLPPAQGSHFCRPPSMEEQGPARPLPSLSSLQTHQAPPSAWAQPSPEELRAHNPRPAPFLPLHQACQTGPAYQPATPIVLLRTPASGAQAPCTQDRVAGPADLVDVLTEHELRERSGGRLLLGGSQPWGPQVLAWPPALALDFLRARVLAGASEEPMWDLARWRQRDEETQPQLDTDRVPVC